MGFGVELDQANALIGAGRTGEAIALLSRVVAKRPREARALHMLGVAKAQSGAHGEAAQLLERASREAPRDALILTDLATLLVMTSRAAEALPLLDKALKLQPALRQAAFYRGVALKNLSRPQEALAAFDQLTAAEPSNPLFQHNRAALLIQFDRLDEAVPIVERLLAQQPDAPAVLQLKSLVLAGQGQLTDAIATCDRILARNPQAEESRYNRGVFKLRAGDFAGGWPDYESRWKRPGFSLASPVEGVPTWSGEPLAGKRLLIFAEQGFGDAMHFCRYAPLAAERGAEVTLHVPQRLVALIKTLSDKIRIVHAIDAGARFDYQIPLLSMPWRMGTDFSNMPNKVPYLAAEDERTRHWREAIGHGGYKIGIAWQGNPGHAMDSGRSIPLTAFYPLSQIPGVRLISLQKSDGLDQIATKPGDMPLETLGAEFDSGDSAFLDTAAVMQNLDLVVTSDTSIAHLGGALGRPTSVALKHAPEWRWFEARSDSPWYPTAKLFRQRVHGDWSDVFARIADDVRTRRT
jgi:tetratricopeptide (TPR) repeat protein